MILHLSAAGYRSVRIDMLCSVLFFVAFRPQSPCYVHHLGSQANILLYSGFYVLFYAQYALGLRSHRILRLTYLPTNVCTFHAVSLCTIVSIECHIVLDNFTGWTVSSVRHILTYFRHTSVERMPEREVVV